MNVIVQGNGVVGSLTAQLIERAGHNVMIHDPAQGLEAPRSRCDVLVIVTPCLDGLLDDLSLIERADQIVVRSTVLPEAFDALPRDRTHHWPEFLTEATAEHDAIHPDKLVWGTEWSAVAALKFIQELVGDHILEPFVLVTSLASAALIKLGINTAYTMKVLLFNALWDAAGIASASYDDVVHGLSLDKRLRVTHQNVWHGGYRGAGGKCLPKDIRILRDAIGVGPLYEMLDAMIEANDELIEATK